MNEINIGTLRMPINSATKTFGILAKRGAGKTYTGGVLAEEFYKNNIPFVVFDPIDVWWGLKLNKNGKDKGLPIVVFGLEHSDIKLDREMGRKIAQAVVKHNISCVISTFGMPKVAQRHLIAEFADEILNINNTPRHIFIEEAHEYVPQKVFGGLGVVFNAVSNLVVMGRNRGLGVTLLNQRAATVNKDVLTQIDTLIAMRSVGPQDRKALKEWVEAHIFGGEGKNNFEKFISTLPSLPTGESWIWSPEFLGIFKKVKIRERETFHPDREKLGKIFEMPQLDQADVQEFINEFSKEIEKKELSSTKLTKGTILQKSTESFEMELIKIKNDYETRIMQKDLEIRRKDEIINQIKKTLDINTQTIQIPVINSNSQLEMWLTKLGNSIPSRILRFLANNPNNSYTREQVALALTTSYKNVSNTAIPLLKRNSLIKEEGGKLRVNQNL